MRDDYHKKRKTWIDFLGGVCVVCGSGDGLEIDHKDRSTKSFDVSSAWSMAKITDEMIFDELRKCQVLCKACHKSKTSKESSFQIHGTSNSYFKYKCRCGACRSYVSLWRSSYRLKTGQTKTSRGSYKKNDSHGTEGFYRRGCRCDLCKAARSKKHLDYVERKKQKEA